MSIKVSQALLRSVLLSLCIFSFLNVTFASCTSEGTYEVDDKHSLIKVGEKLPQFTIQMSNGASLSTSSLEGKPSVVILFRTTCSDCQREFPVLQSLYETYGQKVNFVCIGRAEEKDVVEAYWTEHGLSLPYSPQSDKTVYNLFATQTIPRVYIADASLTVRTIFVEKASEKSLRKAIEKLLQ